jgi:hypothetical protein
MGSWGRRSRATRHGTGVRWLATGLVATTMACSSGSGGPPEARGRWDRIERWEQRSSFDFDRVATTSSPDAVAWFTRQPAADGGGLAYWEIRDGEDPLEVPVPLGDQRGRPRSAAPRTEVGNQVLIPVAVGTDAEGWAAVAVTRDRPAGENEGLMAWHGRLAGDEPVGDGQLLPPPVDATGPPASVSVGRSADVIAVAATYDGDPVIWHRTGNRTPAGGPPARWAVEEPELGTGAGSLVSLRLVGDGERLVLAGVEDDGTAHLWISTDGEDWDAVAGDDVPTGAGAVGLLAAVEQGEVLVGWLDDEDSAPWNATSATIQQLDASAAVTDRGTLEAEPDRDIDRVHLTGATLSPDRRLVMVGAAVRADGVSTPMVWAEDGDDWHASSQDNLAGHLDHEFRVVVSAGDDQMLALAAAMSHPDVEAWRWRAGDPAN